MKKFLQAVFSIALFFTCSSGCHAQSMEQYYTVLDKVQPTSSGQKVEVLEIFWYGCPHCYAFEPVLQEWLPTLPDNVEFRRMPGILNPGWVDHARAYYTAVKLGVLPKIHTALFDALHRDGRRIFNERELRDFFVEQGVNGDDFTRVYESTEITDQLRAAYNLQRDALVDSVPMIIIDGKYMTSPSRAQGYDNVKSVMDHLIEKAAK